MAQWKIPCLFMRSGTSRGTYFMKQHLPVSREAINKVLLRVMGSPDPRQIDGLGGATSVTSKVAIISASNEPGIDVDYNFAQVAIHKASVDWEPSCGNMLAGVGPAAIEMGLIKADHPVTHVKIRAVNNGALVNAIVQTPNHQVTYDGEEAIDGVPGTAAPIRLMFMDVVGSKTGGKLLPTGQLRDIINGVEVTCIDVAMPIVIAKASSFGKTGLESKEELDKDTDFFNQIEAIRLIAGKKMGLGDVTGRVIPKFAIVAEPSGKGNISARYFVPDKTHPAMAVTGGICIGCCSILRGSVADEVSIKTKDRQMNTVVIEHPSGKIQIVLDTLQHSDTVGSMTVNSAGVLRTARLIFEGSVFVSRKGLEEKSEGLEKREGLELQAGGRIDEYRNFHDQLRKDFRKLYKFKGGAGAHKDVNDWVGDEKAAEEVKPSVNGAAVTA